MFLPTRCQQHPLSVVMTKNVSRLGQMFGEGGWRLGSRRGITTVWEPLIWMNQKKWMPDVCREAYLSACQMSLFHHHHHTHSEYVIVTATTKCPFVNQRVCLGAAPVSEIGYVWGLHATTVKALSNPQLCTSPPVSPRLIHSELAEGSGAVC